jgi:hypothetical protein
MKKILLAFMVFGSFGAFAEVPEYCAKKLNGEVIDKEKGIIEFKTMKTIGRRVSVLYTGQVNALCKWNGEGQFLYLNGYIPNQDNSMKVVGTFKNGNFDKHTLFTQGNVQIRERYKNNLLQGERFFTYPNGYRCSEVFNEGVFISSNCQQQAAVPQQYLQPPPQQDSFGNQLGRLADCFANGSCSQQKPKQSICNFKSFEGGIISGDCKQLTIKVGNTTYWKMD